jgi:hypothetical protein
MAEAKKLITKEYRLHSARQLIESITEPANTAYYAFVGNHMDYANASVIPQPNDSVSEVLIDVYKNMIYGKRISPNDISLMIPRNDYTSNKVYDMYDDTVGEANVSLFSSNYYAVVNADAFYHVFKCLDNSLGTNSTVQPEFSEIDPQDEVYQTSDGYVWKYMYTVDNATVRKFATTEFFPVTSNAQVVAAAKSGKLDVIKVENPGRGYDNYCNGIFRSDDLRISGNSRVYSINSSLTANVNSNYYNGCYLYIVAGTGVGQYTKIVDYTVNSSMKAVILRDPFLIPPQSDSHFEITPGVEITGDGTQTANAEARAIVNAAGNTIQRIEMLEVGENYKFASAIVNANPVVGISNTAILRPIFGPQAGHGSDPASELGATRVCISTKFSNNDVEIPLTNDYRTIGVLRDPLFSNVMINFANGTGTFVPSERVFKVSKSVRIATDIVINTTSSIITGNADFVNQLNVGDYVYFTDGAEYQLATVNSITNSSYLTITTNGFFGCTSTKMYKTNIGSQISQVQLSSTQLTGNLVTNTTSTFVYGKGTDFSTQLNPNVSVVYLYGNSSFGGDLKKVVSISVNAFSFNANTNVNGTTEFITLANSALVNNDVVKYYTSNGNTALSGLSNNSYYYVVAANSVGVKLSSTRGGTACNITASSTSENGHFLALQKITIESNASFTNADAKGVLISSEIAANAVGGVQSTFGYVTSVATGTLYVTNVAGTFLTGDIMLGESSGATGYVTSINRSGVNKGFETFSQMYKYVGTPVGGTFTQDELVYQSETTNISEQFANAFLHSVVGTGPATNYYVTNQLGSFNENFNLIGSNSGATTLITGKYSPELVFGSGEVMFLEKIEPITRTSSSSETIKFIFEF